jgi:hypothetical protein
MPVAVPTDLPEDTLLYELRRRGCFTDCFTTAIPLTVTQAQFIEAFYTTPLFKAERLVLRVLAGRKSSDQQARELAHGNREAFAVWRVTQRNAEQILLTDETGRTSSWLMVLPSQAPHEPGTRLYFGSAIRPKSIDERGRPQLGGVFHALLGMHTVYSRRLLQAAAARLQSGVIP